MKKIFLVIISLSIMSFAGSFKLGNTYFNKNGSYNSSKKAYGVKYNKHANLLKRYRDKNNVAFMEFKKQKNKILLSSK